MTLYSMVRDWQILRAGPMLIYWPKVLAQFLSFIVFAFFSFYGLVLWDRGLRSDKVSNTLSLGFSCIGDILK